MGQSEVYNGKSFRELVKSILPTIHLKIGRVLKFGFGRLNLGNRNDLGKVHSKVGPNENVDSQNVSFGQNPAILPNLDTTAPIQKSPEGGSFWDSGSSLWGNSAGDFPLKAKTPPLKVWKNAFLTGKSPGHPSKEVFSRILPLRLVYRNIHKAPSDNLDPKTTGGSPFNPKGGQTPKPNSRGVFQKGPLKKTTAAPLKAAERYSVTRRPECTIFSRRAPCRVINR